METTVLTCEATPNPNAKKFTLSRSVSPHPKSFRSVADAEGDTLAQALFEIQGVNNVLINGDWLTIGKSPDASWPEVEKAARRAIAACAPEST